MSDERTEAIDRALIQRDIDAAAEEWLYMQNEFPVRAALMRRMAFHCRTLLARMTTLEAERDVARAECEYLRETCDGLADALDTKQGVDVMRTWRIPKSDERAQSGEDAPSP